MKKVASFALLISVLAVPAAALAAEFRLGEHPSVNANEGVQDDAYMAGGEVVVAGPVSGDLIALGGSVVVSGAIGADAILGGGTVTILGDVADDVRMGGGTLITQGRVGGDLLAGGGQITVGGPGIAGDVAIGGGTVRIDAPIAGDLRVGGGSVYINAPVGGAVQIDAETVTLGSGAVIRGDLTYKATKELVREEGAVVEGQVTYEPRPDRTPSAAAWAALASAWALGKFLALLAGALAVGLFFKRYSTALVERAAGQPVREIGRGLLIVIAVPVISILLLVTLIGIPLGILGLVSFVALMLFAWIATPIIVGSLVWRYFAKGELHVSWKTIVLGALLYCFIGIVPFIGWIAQALLMLLALGASMALKWEVARAWR